MHLAANKPLARRSDAKTLFPGVELRLRPHEKTVPPQDWSFPAEIVS